MADLHIHTVLSPCAEYLMIPDLIVESALLAGVQLLAVTDHNSGENADAVVSAGKRVGVAVLPGMEVESREGVHMLALFDDVDTLCSWQSRVYAALPDRENDERFFGVQLVVDSHGSLKSINHRLLITSTDMSVETISAEVAERGGLSLPAHVDRQASGILAVLGFIPEELRPVAVEISSVLAPKEAVARFPQLAGMTMIRSSDAHLLADVGRVPTTLLIEEPSVHEILLACRGELGRRLVA